MQNLNILIVDDSATTRAFIKRAIKLSGIPVATMHEARHGGEGLALLACEPVDLILTDLHMPEVDGVQMIATLAQHHEWNPVRVIVVSADPNPARMGALQSRVSAYLRKPFTPEVAVAALTKAMGACHA